MYLRQRVPTHIRIIFWYIGIVGLVCNHLLWPCFTWVAVVKMEKASCYKFCLFCLPLFIQISAYVPGTTNFLLLWHTHLSTSRHWLENLLKYHEACDKKHKIIHNTTLSKINSSSQYTGCNIESEEFEKIFVRWRPYCVVFQEVTHKYE